MGDESRARLGAEAMHKVKDPWREAGCVEELREGACGARRDFRGLGDDAVAARERGCNFERQEIQREVPWRDDSHDTDGLARSVAAHGGWMRNAIQARQARLAPALTHLIASCIAQQPVSSCRIWPAKKRKLAIAR